MKRFLEGVFTDAFKDPRYRAGLIEDIVTRRLDAKLLATLLGYYAGKPTQPVDHTVGGTLTLAQLIVGDLPSEALPPEGEAEESEE